MNASTLVAKVWNYAHVLRDDGVGYGDYIEQITCLLFLKLDEEMKRQLGEPSRIPAKYQWSALARLEGDDLERQYVKTLDALGREKGLLGTIFRKAQNKVRDPAKLKRIVSMIDEENWTALDLDIKGEIYEGLLERNANEVKSGAGQYFTPRPLIRAMVEVTQPTPKETVHDPACGTGGFLLAAYEYMRGDQLDKRTLNRLKTQSLSGVDIVDGVARLCAMNLFLHGIGGDESPVAVSDALLKAAGSYDVILTNPPFGKKSSYTVVTEEGEIAREQQTYERTDFIATTSNKQLNFLQHIMSSLKVGGRAAVVMPDNVLFEGGAGEKVRKRLLDNFELHTILRLPTGIWYSPGVKANVLFFEKRPASDKPWTKHVWYYDFRTNQHFTLRQNPLKTEHLQDFIACYRAGDRAKRKESERFHRFAYADLVKRDKLNLDIFWLKDESLADGENLPPPHVLAEEIIENLETALEQFRAVAEALPKSG